MGESAAMKTSLSMSCLRVLAVMSSASLLGGYVWFTQRNAQSAPVTEMPQEAKVTVGECEGFINYGKPIDPVTQVTVPPSSSTVILSTKNISQPIFSTRKVEGAIQMMKPDVAGGADPFAPTGVPPSAEGSHKEATSPPSQVVMPGSKRSTSIVTPDQIDGLLQKTSDSSASQAMMPGSKAGVLKLPIAGQTPAVSEKAAGAIPAKRATMMPGSKSYGDMMLLPETRSENPAAKANNPKAAAPPSPPQGALMPDSKAPLLRMPSPTPAQPSPAKTKP